MRNRVLALLSILLISSVYIVKEQTDLTETLRWNLKKVQIIGNNAVLSIFENDQPPSPMTSYQAISTNTSQIVEATSFFKETPTPSYQERLSAAMTQASKEVFYILVWEPPFNTRRSPRVNYKICGACQIGYNKTKVNDSATKAIVFHFKELKIDKMPSIRRDSDFYGPYGNAEEFSLSAKSYTEKLDKIMAKKKFLALWLVSNCGGSIGAEARKVYVERLVAAGLDLHKRGRCYSESGQVETKYLITKYKFYLAFENSFHCKDYITEKLFENAFQMGAVPVVWGATKEDYEAVAPPESFIFAEDFETPSDLVKYLNYLNNNDTAYREYFTWRSNKIVSSQHGRQRGFCSLCRAIHGVNVDNIRNPKYEKMREYIPNFGFPTRPRIISSISDWYFGNETRECLPWMKDIQ